MSGPHLGVLPVVGSAPETGVQYGGTVFRIQHLGPDATTRSSIDQVYATYTLRHQLKAFLGTDRWLPGNRWRVRARLEYQRYPLPFFGIGPNSSVDDEEWYTAQGPSLHTLVERRLSAATYLVAGYRFDRLRMKPSSPDGALAGGTVRGSRGGTTSLLQGGVLRDSRDNLFSTRSGSLTALTLSLSASALGATFTFPRVDVDVRRYVTLGRVVLAGLLEYQGAGAQTPFDQLPAIGADSIVRGYERGRYRDHQLLAGQLELRPPHWRRVGVVAFAAAGTVAPRIGDLTSSPWHPSVGAGLRLDLFPRERSAIRIDYGKGRGSGGLYLGINEAF